MKKEIIKTDLILPPTPEFIERRIHVIRGQKVMLDAHLAELYQVPTMRLNEQVKRNTNRFPADFMFRLTNLQLLSFLILPLLFLIIFLIISHI